MKKTILLAIIAYVMTSTALALPNTKVKCPSMFNVQSVVQNIKAYDTYWHGGSSGPVYRIHANAYLPNSIVVWMCSQANPKDALLAIRVPTQDDTSGISWLSKPIALKLSFGTVCQYSTAGLLQMNAVLLSPTA